MKRKSILILLMVMVITLASFVPAISQIIGDGSTALVAGARYEEKTLGTYGLAVNLGGVLWEVTTIDIAPSPTVNVEVMALFKLPIGEKLYGGFVGGANGFFRDMPEEAPFLTYLQAAAGVVGTYGFSDQVGLGGYLKRYIPLEENALTYSWTGGISFWLRL